MNDTKTQTLTWAVAGPALVGACIGLPHGLGAVAQMALAMPLVAVGTFALTAPALYIASAFVGAAPPARDLAVGVRGALRDAGMALLGFSPGLLFLTATSSDARFGLLLGVATFCLGGFIGLRRVLSRVYGQAALAMLPVFLPWAVVTAGIGLHLTYRVVA